MAKITLEKLAADELARRLRKHLKEEFEVDIEPFDSVRLVDFLTQTFGPYFYNQGLLDAQKIVKDRAEAIVEAIYEIEQPLPRR